MLKTLFLLIYFILNYAVRKSVQYTDLHVSVEWELCRGGYFLLPKSALFHNEKESKRIRARCQVSLEKSSKNYSRCENAPSQAKCIASPLPHLPVNRRVFLAGFPCGGAESAK
jgi:hypothetical protein